MEATKVSYTDLLIIGAGPAGLMAAAWASRYKISARIIDKSSARVSRGHADGLQCRTMEILDSFGLADRIRKEGFHDHEICSWDSSGDYGIQRVEKVLSQKVGVSRFPQTIIHQGYIEQEILDFLEQDGGSHVERCTVPREIFVDYSRVNEQGSYPITVKIDCREGRKDFGVAKLHFPPNHCASGQPLGEDINGHVNGQMNGHMNGYMNEYQGKDQREVKYDGGEEFGSSSNTDLREIENGSANRRLTPNGCQPSKASTNRIGEDATHARHKSLQPTPNELLAPESNVETIKAKYLLGCDGAHSWTRQQLGIKLEGNQTQNVWGVIDIIPLTDFPDIRQTCVIRSAMHGSLMIAPREGRLVRLYVQLNEKSDKDDDSASRGITPPFILEAAKKIFRPYTLDFNYLDWWSIYRIQQRVASQFSVANRIFLAGDAIHTHSPKLGQGMNVSMQDTYNLAWKICSVINGTAKQEILETYETERRQVALDLVAADQKINSYYTRRSGEDLGQTLDYKSLRNSLYEFLSGAAVNYGPSILTLKRGLVPINGHVFNGEQTLSDTSPLASKLKIGMRIPSYKIINQADARCVQLGEMLQSDGRWRIVTFAGNLSDPVQSRRVQLLGEFLGSSGSGVRKYTPSHRSIDSVIEVLTVHSGPRAELDLLSLHHVFHPYDEVTGWDYWKVFVDEPSPHEVFDDVYGKYGIDRQRGCLVICRPDQHVGCVLEVEDFTSLSRYFEGVLIPAGSIGVPSVS